eukprot:g29096.t1
MALLQDMDMAESCATKAKDFEEKFRQLLHPEDEAHVAEKEMKEEEQSIAEDLPEVGESGELWLEIDNVAYDLTEFIGKHPGGDQILRQFAGKDASKAFHKAKHSMKAKMQMQMLGIIGVGRTPISPPDTGLMNLNDRNFFLGR